MTGDERRSREETMTLRKMALTVLMLIVSAGIAGVDEIRVLRVG